MRNGKTYHPTSDASVQHVPFVEAGYAFIAQDLYATVHEPFVLAFCMRRPRVGCVLWVLCGRRSCCTLSIDAAEATLGLFFL